MSLILSKSYIGRFALQSNLLVQRRATNDAARTTINARTHHSSLPYDIMIFCIYGKFNNLRVRWTTSASFLANLDLNLRFLALIDRLDRDRFKYPRSAKSAETDED